MSLLCPEIILGKPNSTKLLPEYISSFNQWIPNKVSPPELWGSKVDIKFNNGEITYDSHYHEWDWTVGKGKSIGGYNISFYRIRKLC